MTRYTNDTPPPTNPRDEDEGISLFDPEDPFEDEDEDPDDEDAYRRAEDLESYSEFDEEA